MIALDYLIRSATKADEPFLWEMLYQAIYIPEGEPRPSREIASTPELARYVRNWGRDGDIGLIALCEHNHQPVGAVWLRLLTGDNPGYGYIDDATPELSMAILPEHRGRRIGTHLLTRMLEIAANTHKAVSLSVSADNPALRLYERLGFEVVVKEATSLIMMKQLNTQSAKRD